MQVTNLHAVEKRARNGVQGVGSAHEEDFGEVNGDVQVVVHKGAVLLRVQQLKKRRGRIPLIPCMTHARRSPMLVWLRIYFSRADAGSQAMCCMSKMMVQGHKDMSILVSWACPYWHHRHRPQAGCKRPPDHL